EPDAHRPILPDDPVRLALGAVNLLRRDLAREIDGRVLHAEMKALGPDAEQAIEGGRQHVLTRVLLHVIEPPRPVDRPVQRRRRGRAIDDVEDPSFVRVHDVEDADVAERARIGRLTAGGWIERRAIEYEGGLPLMRRRVEERRVELAQVGIRVIQTFSHHVPGGFAPPDPPTRTLAGTPAPLRVRGSRAARVRW